MIVDANVARGKTRSQWTAFGLFLQEDQLVNNETVADVAGDVLQPRGNGGLTDCIPLPSRFEIVVHLLETLRTKNSLSLPSKAQSRNQELYGTRAPVAYVAYQWMNAKQLEKMHTMVCIHSRMHNMYSSQKFQVKLFCNLSFWLKLISHPKILIILLYYWTINLGKFNFGLCIGF